MFERFTDQARRVMVLTEQEARGLNHNYIGTEHLLLGLIHEGVAAKVLESLGISLLAVRLRVVEIIGRGQQKPTGSIPFTPRAKKALELGLREALAMGHHAIGTEHILLGVLREGEGVAAQVLVKLGANEHRVRERLNAVLPPDTGEAVGDAGGEPPGSGAPVVALQMLAYNAHDPDGLAACYADDARIIDGSGDVMAAGREAIRGRYRALFARSPTVQATCVERMVVGAYVVEHERAQGVEGPGAGVVDALVLYKIAEGQIVEARFLT